MSIENVSLAVEVPDCAKCGKQIRVGDFYYESATQHTMRVACVPSGVPRGKLVKALPEVVTVCCEDCAPSGLWHDLGGM